MNKVMLTLWLPSSFREVPNINQTTHWSFGASRRQGRSEIWLALLHVYRNFNKVHAVYIRILFLSFNSYLNKMKQIIGIGLGNKAHYFKWPQIKITKARIKGL